MNETSQTIQERIRGLEEGAGGLIVRLLALAADLAREGYWDYLPAVMAAVQHAEAARQALDSHQGEKADLPQGPINPPPIDGLQRSTRSSPSAPP